MHTPRPDNVYWGWVPSAFALAGIVLFVFATFGPPASSSGFVTSLKGALSQLAPDYAESHEHYRMMPGPGSWLMAFVLGMAMGGFVGGRTLRKPMRDVPVLWERRFGQDRGGRVKRYLACFAGGFLILFGARLAGGCTLGLFISGSTQLAVSGLYFGVVIFAVAMLVARLVYGRTVREVSR
ncbi:MAG: YeeE/YedE thiosulfate transporter family protein [Deferrisomatales bacterium]|nr:YeeE/YedE thiosulfate transporter family protein [Deferrisomatales bacterium]